MSIEAWLDEDTTEVLFCLKDQIDMHVKAGTVSKNIRKIRDFNTNSMTEAHKMFQESLEEAKVEEGSLEEGWN